MALEVPAWVRVAFYSGSSLVFGIIMGFFAKAEWINFYKYVALPVTGTPISLILMPISLALNAGLFILAIIELFNSGFTLKNIASVFVELGKTVQTTVSLCSLIVFIPASALLVPILLVIAMSGDALFNLGNCALNLWRLYNAVTPIAIHQNKMLAIKYGVGFIISALLTIFIGITFLSGIGGIALLACGITTALIASVGGIISVAVSYYADQRANKIIRVIPPGYEELSDNSSEDAPAFGPLSVRPASDSDNEEPAPGTAYQGSESDEISFNQALARAAYEEDECSEASVDRNLQNTKFMKNGVSPDARKKNPLNMNSIFHQKIMIAANTLVTTESSPKP